MSTPLQEAVNLCLQQVADIRSSSSSQLYASILTLVADIVRCNIHNGHVCMSTARAQSKRPASLKGLRARSHEASVAADVD